MSRSPFGLTHAFARARADGRAAILPYLCAGDPNLEATAAHLRALEGVADAVEVGVPFSDPVADGPVIQAAAERGRRAGATLARVIDLVAGLRRDGLRLPVVLMTYYNPVHRMGIARFVGRAVEAGVDGVIVPDLPVDEAGDLVAGRDGLATIFLAAPTSTDARLEKIAAASTGFVYYVSLEGVTGERDRLAADLGRNIARVRRRTDLPVAVGFGISTPDHARAVARAGADGVVVGSALVRRIAAGAAPAEAAAFVGELRAAARPA